jgi:hypothetical protein
MGLFFLPRAERFPAGASKRQVGRLSEVTKHFKPRSAFQSAKRGYYLLVGIVRHWIARGRWRVRIILGVAIFILLGVPGSLGNFVIYAWTRGGWIDVSVVLALAGILYAITFAALDTIVGTVVWSRLRTVARRESRCRVLIMGLSELPKEQIALLETIKVTFRDRGDCYGLPTKDYLALPGFSDGQLQTMALKWQQNVRAARQHGDRLQAILVLPSEESLQQWEHFCGFMEFFFPGISVRRVLGHNGQPFRQPTAPGTKDFDYEDYEYVWTGLTRAVDQAQESFHDRPLADDEICIDVTAGQKTFTMAGANVTLNLQRKLSYVSNDGIVAVYHAEIDTAGTLRRVLNAGGAGL